MSRIAPKSPASPLSTAVSIGVVVAALYFAQEVLIPLALSVLLAFLLAPLVTRLQRNFIGRTPAVLVVVAVAFCFIALVGFIVGDQVVQLARDLPNYQTEIGHKVESVRSRFGNLGSFVTRLGSAMEKATVEPATKPADKANPATMSVTEAAAHEVANPADAAAREATGAT
ncbi:MAG: AI-2E family transporter, partial [Phycisphaerae bacterium]|nr:AI-2E family transporter [Phycisphaerae bacterium]